MDSHCIFHPNNVEGLKAMAEKDLIDINDLIAYNNYTEIANRLVDAGAKRLYRADICKLYANKCPEVDFEKVQEPDNGLPEGCAKNLEVELYLDAIKDKNLCLALELIEEGLPLDKKFTISGCNSRCESCDLNASASVIHYTLRNCNSNKVLRALLESSKGKDVCPATDSKINLFQTAAGSKNPVEKTKLLLEFGFEGFNKPDNNGFTPLHCFCLFGEDSSEYAKFVFENGADLNARTFDMDRTPLFYCRVGRNDTTIKSLIELGCEVNFNEDPDLRDCCPDYNNEDDKMKVSKIYHDHIKNQNA